MSLDNVQVSEDIFMIFRRLGHTVGSNFSFKMILITPKILEFNQTFHAPEIDAPKLEKEMMFSYLQKNFSQDLRKIKLIFMESLSLDSPK